MAGGHRDRPRGQACFAMKAVDAFRSGLKMLLESTPVAAAR
jgi:hypothetical protein